MPDAYGGIIYVYAGKTLLINGDGALRLSAGNTTAFYLESGASAIIDGSAAVTVAAYDIVNAVGGGARTLAIGDAASLIIENPRTLGQSVTVTAYPSTSSAMWKLTDSATTGDPLTATSITVAIPAATTGTVAREPIPVAPTITSPNKLSVVAGTGGILLLTATGYPAPTWSLTGAPAGVSITGSTLTVASTVPAGTYTFSITASNGVEPDATQSFTLTVTKAGGGGNNNGDGKIPPMGDALNLLAPVALLMVSAASAFVASDWKKRH